MGSRTESHKNQIFRSYLEGEKTASETGVSQAIIRYLETKGHLSTLALGVDMLGWVTRCYGGFAGLYLLDANSTSPHLWPKKMSLDITQEHPEGKNHPCWEPLLQKNRQRKSVSRIRSDSTAQGTAERSEQRVCQQGGHGDPLAWVWSWGWQARDRKSEYFSLWDKRKLRVVTDSNWLPWWALHDVENVRITVLCPWN